MPGRQSHGWALSAKAKPKPAKRINSKKRSLEAFTIAQHQNPDKIKIRQSRLGVQEGGNGPGKRRRDEDEDDEDEEDVVSSKKVRKSSQKGRFDELDIEEGSDSEGNNWKMGQVDSDDDSDLDSDEAFGESDQERYDGFAFSGSSDKKSKKKKHDRAKNVNLEEDEEDTSDSELEEGDLGEGAVDLADMLDMSSDDEEAPAEQGRAPKDQESDSGEEEDSEESEAESSVSSMDEDDESADPAKHEGLQNLIANLPQVEESRRGHRGPQGDQAVEHNAPTDFGLTPKTKLTLEDLGISSIGDAEIKRSLKHVDSGSKSKQKSARRLEVPLARRQQDRLDRSAAYDKSKEELSRWTDTVAHNRRADHLMFPLPNTDTEAIQNNKQLQPTNFSKPFNELEATIKSIMEESGLAPANGKDDEDHLREFEQLETNKQSLEEVKARRVQLRMARELMFREEARAKRIKKIKSKSYRKVHRKQREKEERLNQEALAEGGYVPSEDELEKQDRKRAEERMGARHRGSKWAKGMKESGRTTWDEEARSAMTDLARRDEELRKRVEGRVVRKEFENESDASTSDSDDDLSQDDEEAEQSRLLRLLEKARGAETVDESAPGSKLANMKFMKTADAARKKANDAVVEDMRREIAGEDPPSSDEEAGEIGRRIFGPSGAAPAGNVKPKKLNEFEEPIGSDEDEDELEIHGVDNAPKGRQTSSHSKAKKQPDRSLGRPAPQPPPAASQEGGGAWSRAPAKPTMITEGEAKRRRQKKNDALDVELDLSQAAVLGSHGRAKKSGKEKSQPFDVPDYSEESGDDIQLPFAIRDQELIKRAFAGADVVGEFEAEKKQTVEDDDDKVVDNTIPGWGSWVGNGVSKRDKRKSKGRFLTKVAGVNAKDRRDAQLDRVIINEKKVKKNDRYLAPSLPHPFESRQQYERSLRLPIGPDWTTKATFQDATKPRILLKQGIITPMSKPLL